VLPPRFGVTLFYGTEFRFEIYGKRLLKSRWHEMVYVMAGQMIDDDSYICVSIIKVQKFCTLLTPVRVPQNLGRTVVLTKSEI